MSLFVSNRDIAESMQIGRDVFSKFCLVSGGVTAPVARVKSRVTPYTEKGMELDATCQFLRARSALFGPSQEARLRDFARAPLRAVAL